MVEDGVSSGARNFGRLCLSAIPWALGLGAAVWLGVWGGLHTYRHQLAMEARAARYVGSVTPQQSPIKIEVIARDCVRVSRADVDGSTLLIYAKNTCHEQIRYAEYHYQEISLDGTVLSQEYHNEASCGIPIFPGDSGECKFDIPMDDRTDKIRVWMSR